MDTDYDHPRPFRPAGSSPNPDQQYDAMSRKPVPFTTTSLSRPNSNQQAQNSQANNYSSRFPSNQLSQETYSQVTQPTTTQSPSQSQTPQARSRSSTQNASPQRPGGVGLAPSSYHTSARPSNNGNTAKSPAVQSPSQQYQSLYSRPASSYQSPNITRGLNTTQPNLPPLSQQQQHYQSEPPQSSSSSSSHPSTSQFTTPISGPPLTRKTNLLLLNPTSAPTTTTTLLQSLRPKLPPHVEITGYTAPLPAPTAIESQTDAILASETVIRDLAPHSAHNSETVLNFDGILVASYFPLGGLIDSLREIYDVPIVGVLEASLYLARSLGGRYGIIASGGRRGRVCHADAVTAMGLAAFDVGTEIVHLGGSGSSGSGGGSISTTGPGGISSGPSTGDSDRQQLSHMHTRGGSANNDPNGLALKKIGVAAHRLVMKGADIIVLALSPFAFTGINTEAAIRAAKDAVRDDDGRRLVNVIDPVEAGVMMLTALAGMGCPTSKKGVFASAAEVRRLRSQDWL